MRQRGGMAEHVIGAAMVFETAALGGGVWFGGRESDGHQAASISSPRIAASRASITASRRATLGMVAPFGSGFLSDLFHLLKVVGWMPAALQTSETESPARFARASRALRICCWSMAGRY